MSVQFDNYLYNVLVAVILVLNSNIRSTDAFGTFGFDIHHRYSDRVKGILDLDGLPEKGSHEYYAAMAHRDRRFHGRRLSGESTSVTFAAGNETHRLDSLGYLYYANVSMGTPSLWFLVALDTGSDLFWLPCDCLSCVSPVVDFNIYSPNTSSTSKAVFCNSDMCQQKRRCSSVNDACPYQVQYLSDDTSSTGLLVEDVLHLYSQNGDNKFKVVDAQIKFGCGRIQTGSFLDGVAPNGLFGLGMHNISVPSILAKSGLAANSFSMCFGAELGRINFGDKGSSDQGQTPFNLHQLHPTYYVSVAQVSVGNNTRNIDFAVIFDSGTSFTYLNDPAYTAIVDIFNSQAQENRLEIGSSNPFEYCYELSGNETTVPTVNLTFTMKGGDPFYFTDPLVLYSVKGGGFIYCLGLVKSEDVNIIGENFMTGYNIVFDRENMVLGWKASDCFGAEDSDSLTSSPRGTGAPAPTPRMHPTATSAQSPELGAFSPSSSNNAQWPSPLYLMAIFYFYTCYSIIIVS